MMIPRKKFSSMCRIILLCLFLCATTRCFASVGLDNQINELLRKHPEANIGIVIRQASTGKILYQHRADFLYSPASTQKLFTAIAGLTYLGANYHFATQLLTNGEIVDHTLRGDLIVRFTGDPELKSKEVVALLAHLKSAGVKNITGHVYIDDYDYSSIYYAPGWMWNDLSYSFAAPLSPIIINRNCFILDMTPSKTLGLSPALSPKLISGVLHLHNSLKTTKNYNKHCPLTIYSDANNNYYLHGCLVRNGGMQRRTLAIRDPFAFAQALIAESLTALSIQFNPHIERHLSLHNDLVLASHSSPPLNQIIHEMLKKSDNLTTDTVLKKIGQLYFHSTGTWQNGLRALKQILATRTGINFEKNLINDGAGLSRYNLVSPMQETMLLQYAYHNQHVMPYLLDALPIAGKDGTLIWRLRWFKYHDQIHAKTGSMTGVSALAGFINTQHMGVLTFSIIVNGFVGRDIPFVNMQDRMMAMLTSYQPL